MGSNLAATSLARPRTDHRAAWCPAELKKGPVLFTAQLAGIQAAKKTSDLIPLCHPVPLTKVAVELDLRESDHSVHIESTVITASVSVCGARAIHRCDAPIRAASG